MLARRKLNSIESTISKALIDNEISHEHFTTINNEEKNYRDEHFTTINNEEKNYRELKKSIRTMKSQTSDNEKTNLIEKCKRISVDKITSRDY